MPIQKLALRTSILPLLLLVSSMAAAQAPDPSFGAFVPFGKLQAKLDDRVLVGAEILFSDRPGAYLLRAAGLDQPLLINVRSQSLKRLKSEGLRDNSNGTVTLLSGAVAATVGPFEVGGQELTAKLGDGRRLILGPKPDLLGDQTAKSIQAYDPSYSYRLRQYPPSEKTLERLRQEQRQVTVRVYFGSWCATCARFLPWLMSVEERLEGSNIRFEYYGLPHAMNDPKGKEAGIDSVPVAVVTVDGKELGRRSAQGLGVPEKALLKILGGG